MTRMDIGGAEEDRTPDLRIAKPKTEIVGNVNQPHTHTDPARM